MDDPELAKITRCNVESQELLQAHRGLARQIELIDCEPERCSDRGRREELRIERARIFERLAETHARLRACWTGHAATSGSRTATSNMSPNKSSGTPRAASPRQASPTGITSPSPPGRRTLPMGALENCAQHEPLIAVRNVEAEALTNNLWQGLHQLLAETCVRSLTALVLPDHADPLATASRGWQSPQRSTERRLLGVAWPIASSAWPSGSRTRFPSAGRRVVTVGCRLQAAI
jgi:hypothetical protein